MALDLCRDSITYGRCMFAAGTRRRCDPLPESLISVVTRGGRETAGEGSQEGEDPVGGGGGPAPTAIEVCPPQDVTLPKIIITDEFGNEIGQV